MQKELHGKVALITGASKGVGKGIALQLGRHGASVVVNYNSDKAGAEATAAELRSLGAPAIVVQGDVGKASDVDALFEAVKKDFGRLDILVNNAGVQTWKALLELEEEEWDHVLDTNLKGCFLCTQRAARIMKNAGGGRIINIGSGCNKVAFPRLVNYTASKGGIEQFTKVSAVELGQYGIRVNCVAPGAVEIERTKEEAGDYAGTWAAATPLGRVGTPMDIGRAVVFFCGELSDFVTGQTLYVDGGLFAKPHWPYEY
ncbi:MAG TPA: 3-oxoacyl-ACP reductase family protein [Bryobacteraceae bacterium]|nr:3-oxoacyl-ACP reductase family protein [Bryobacteraceae bacterium]